MATIHTYLPILKRNPLFKGIDEDKLISLLDCLGARTARYPKDSFILRSGDEVTFVGIMLTGAAFVIKEDVEGNRTIVASLAQGDYFAEALCCADIKKSPVSVVTTADTTILQLEFHRILKPYPHTCGFQPKLIENMLQILAQKNLFLQNRLEIISRRTMREKIMGYLESESNKQGPEVTIPLNREELADFLNVDRSALSHELSKMRDDELIEYRKNHFTLLR